MDWVSANWVWILIAIAFVAMHMFGHGGHGRHASHGEEDGRAGSGPSAKRRENSPASHRH
jgi:hypothetical protein